MHIGMQRRLQLTCVMHIRACSNTCTRAFTSKSSSSLLARAAAAHPPSAIKEHGSEGKDESQTITSSSTAAATTVKQIAKEAVVRQQQRSAYVDRLEHTNVPEAGFMFAGGSPYSIQELAHVVMACNTYWPVSDLDREHVPGMPHISWRKLVERRAVFPVVASDGLDVDGAAMLATSTPRVLDRCLHGSETLDKPSAMSMTTTTLLWRPDVSKDDAQSYGHKLPDVIRHIRSLVPGFEVDAVDVDAVDLAPGGRFIPRTATSGESLRALDEGMMARLFATSLALRWRLLGEMHNEGSTESRLLADVYAMVDENVDDTPTWLRRFADGKLVDLSGGVRVSNGEGELSNDDSSASTNTMTIIDGIKHPTVCIPFTFAPLTGSSLSGTHGTIHVHFARSSTKPSGKQLLKMITKRDCETAGSNNQDHHLVLWLAHDDDTTVAPRYREPHLHAMLDPNAPRLAFISGRGCIAPSTLRLLRVFLG